MVKKNVMSASAVPPNKEEFLKTKDLLKAKASEPDQLSSVRENMQKLPAVILLPTCSRDVLEEVGYQVRCKVKILPIPKKDTQTTNHLQQLAGKLVAFLGKQNLL